MAAKLTTKQRDLQYPKIMIYIDKKAMICIAQKNPPTILWKD